MTGRKYLRSYSWHAWGPSRFHRGCEMYFESYPFEKPVPLFLSKCTSTPEVIDLFPLWRSRRSGGAIVLVFYWNVKCHFFNENAGGAVTGGAVKRHISRLVGTLKGHERHHRNITAKFPFLWFSWFFLFVPCNNELRQTRSYRRLPARCASTCTWSVK